MLLNTRMHILQIVCERSEVFASACALVRAFPQFSRKTNSTVSDSSLPKTKEKSSHAVNVEFICTDGRSVTEEDVPCLNHVARGIQMTARIVDTPCNEMHTDAFLDVRVVCCFALHSARSISNQRAIQGAIPVFNISLSHFPAHPGGGQGLVHQSNDNSRGAIERERIWRNIWGGQGRCTQAGSGRSQPHSRRSDGDDRLGRKGHCIRHRRTFHQG